MKLCDTCIYRNNVEQLKPCIIYRDNCEYYEKEGNMTKEQSIKWLKDMLKNFDLPQEQYQTALEMAIKALEQEPCGETVSLEAFKQVIWERNIAIDQLHELGYDFGQKIEPCGDAVSRQAVRDAMCALCNTGETLKENPWRDNPHIDAIIDALDNLLPITPQPKMGRWIRWYEQKEYDWGIEHIPHCKCSECGKEYEPHSSQFIKYCNECGAKMSEVEE